MSIKALILLFFIACFPRFIHAQSLSTKQHNLDSFGIVEIPVIIDTLGQDIVKKSLIENTLETLDKKAKKTMEDEFKINVTKALISNYDPSVYLFYPTKSLLSLFKTENILKLANDTSDGTALEDFQIIPNMLLQRKMSKVKPSELKPFITNKVEAEKFTTNLAASYLRSVEAMYVGIKTKNVTSKCYLYLNESPIFKVSFKYYIEKEPQKVYSQDLYSIFSKNKMYVIRFEYNDEERKLWSLYEENFFKTLKLY